MPATDKYQELLDTLPQRYTQFDLAMAWAIKVSSNETVVEGVLKNLRYAYMEDVELRIVAVDALGGTIARSTCFVLPRQLRLDDVATFTVRLPLQLLTGTRLRFTYKYRGSDGGEGGTDWLQTFESEVPDIAVECPQFRH